MRVGFLQNGDMEVFIEFKKGSSCEYFKKKINT